MKNPFEVLRLKEQELLRVKKEVEALRTVARLLGDEPPSTEEEREMRGIAEMR